jgi:putative two-component system response regulator
MATDQAIRDPVRVLFIEDNPEDVSIVRRLLGQYQRASFQVISAPTTSAGLERLRGDGADLILLDYCMPGEDGVSFLRRAAADAELPPVIMLSGQGDERLVVEAMRSGAYDYFPKDALTPSVLGGALQRAIEQFRERDEGALFDEQIMVALAAAAEGKDPTTGGHLQRLAHYALLAGEELGLELPQLRLLRFAALLHDIGKLAVRASVLCKAGPLTDGEWDEIHQHPLVGERICTFLSCSRQVCPIIRHHHERWDGQGYVDGLAGDDIPLLARIVSVVDAYDAMSSDRPYRKALAKAEAVRRLRAGAGSQWDPEIVQVFLEVMAREGLGRANHSKKRRHHVVEPREHRHAA